MSPTAPHRTPDASDKTRYRPGGAISHPLILTLLALWIVNDHLLKDLLANGLTGKLSDVASLAVFPLLPYCTYEVICAWRGRYPNHRHWVLLASLLATGSVMVGINISDAWAHAYEVGLSMAQWPFRFLRAMFMGHSLPKLDHVQLTMDPSDIWTLPTLLIPWWVARSTRSPSSPRSSSTRSPESQIRPS